MYLAPGEAASPKRSYRVDPAFANPATLYVIASLTGNLNAIKRLVNIIFVKQVLHLSVTAALLSATIFLCG